MWIREKKSLFASPTSVVLAALTNLLRKKDTAKKDRMEEICLYLTKEGRTGALIYELSRADFPEEKKRV